MAEEKRNPDPVVADHGDQIVALTGGPSGEHVIITDSKELSELRELIKTREEVGRKLSKKLAEFGMISAASIDATQVTGA